MEVMIAILILAVGLTTMISGIKIQGDMRASVATAKRYLDVARGLRERFDSIRYTDIGHAPASSARISWSQAHAMGDVLADDMLSDGDGGLGEADLIRIGILGGPIGDNLRVFFSYRRAISMATARGACDQGWDSTIKEPLDWTVAPTPTQSSDAWDAAENWDVAPVTTAQREPIAVRISMIWSDGSGRAGIMGRTLSSPAGKPFRRHDIYLVRSP